MSKTIRLQTIRVRKGRSGIRIDRLLALLAAALLLTFGGGCSEEGSGERAGREIDEAVGEARERTEGTLEDLGREVDEAVEEGEEAARKLRDTAK